MERPGKIAGAHPHAQGGEARPGVGGAQVGGVPDQGRPTPGVPPTAAARAPDTYAQAAGWGGLPQRSQTVLRHAKTAGS